MEGKKERHLFSSNVDIDRRFCPFSGFPNPIKLSPDSTPAAVLATRYPLCLRVTSIHARAALLLTRLSLEQVLTLISSNVRNGSEDVCTMSSRSFYTISMINSSLSSFMIDVKVLKVVVEIHTSCTEITTQKSGMCGKDGGDVDVSLTTKRDS